jgi:myo-inositol 2-dehydrogenase / D-chiro-inositol 1-dehydrogenase
MAEPPQQMRVGVIGLGWIGEAHLADLAGRDDVTIAAVHDVDPARVGHCAERFGARGYADGATLFAQESLDAVWICTPPQHHLDPTLLAVSHGVPMYLEKPVARDVADAHRIVEAVAGSGLVCAVGYQWHALDLLTTVRAELAGQPVGYLLGQSIGPTAARPWFLANSQGGGNLLERGSHHIDLVRAVAGEVAAVQATASSVRLTRPGTPGQDIDDALTLVLRLATGAVATIAVAWTQDDGPARYGLDVVASESVLHLDLDPRFHLSGRSRGRDVDERAAGTPFARSLTRFLDAVRAGDPGAVACTPADAMRTLRVALAGEKALATGATVQVG